VSSDKSRETTGDEYSKTSMSLQECLDGLFDNDAILDDQCDQLKDNFIGFCAEYNDLVDSFRLWRGISFAWLLLSTAAIGVLFWQVAK